MSFKSGGATSNFAVTTPSDSVDLSYPPEYLHVEQDGDLVVHNHAGTATTLAVQAGFVYVSPKRILSTGHGAGQVVGFWED